MSTIKHETSSQVIRCNDERATLQLCKPSFLLINGVVATMRHDQRHKDCVSEHEHVESHRRCHKPTMLTTAIVSLCSHTVKCKFHSLAGSRSIRSSSHMGMVPKVLYRSNTFWLRQSRRYKRVGKLRQQGSMQLETVGC